MSSLSIIIRASTHYLLQKAWNVKYSLKFLECELLAKEGLGCEVLAKESKSSECEVLAKESLNVVPLFFQLY